MSARLVVVEGLDGAGKNTLTTALVAELARRDLAVGRLAFPRYGTPYADLAADALHGGQAGTADSPHAMALLFAMDRHAALGELSALAGANDVVLLDRYVASNAAYTAARSARAGRRGRQWIGALEFDRGSGPGPADPAGHPGRAGRRADGLAGGGRPGRTRDRYERDAALRPTRHGRTGGWPGVLASPWSVVGSSPMWVNWPTSSSGSAT